MPDEKPLHPNRCVMKAIEQPAMPVFCLLPTDPLAPRMVRKWAEVAVGTNTHEPAKIREAHEVADAMEAWALKKAVGSSAPAAWPFPVSPPGK